MGVILNTNYRLWNGTSSVVGWPYQEPYAYERIAAASKEYAEAGFSAVLLPPSTKGGANTASDGYDLYDSYDIGSKNQPFIKPTSFGDATMLRKCVSSIHANGMDVYGDLVVHQYGGGNSSGVYKPLGADGKTRNGRFPKTASCFVGVPPRVAVDPVPDMQGNFAFGDMASYVNSLPAHYMHDETIAATQWLVRTLDLDGFRIDDVKGTNAAFLWDLLHSDYLNKLYAFGEYFDGNNTPLWNWVHGYMTGRAAVLDFGFKFNVGNICNNNSRIWMGRLADIGFCNVDAANAITFVESADTDNSPGEQVIWNKMLGYAIMLTFPGYPAVYYRDWSTDPGCYGLKHNINNLIWIHENLAQGDFVPRLSDHPQVFVHERLGYGDAPGCICGFNNDQFNQYTVTVQTRYPANTRLHEYTGKYNTDIWTDAQGRATFTLPKNINGLSYLVFGLWVGPKNFTWKAKYTKQVFFGAADLDIPPLVPGDNIIGNININKNHPVTIVLSPAISANIYVISEFGVRITDLTKITDSGNYEIHVSNNTTLSYDFELTVDYVGI